MSTTILQIRNENTMEAINIEIKVEDIERFKSFMRKQELRYTFEQIDLDEFKKNMLKLTGADELDVTYESVDNNEYIEEEEVMI